MGATPLVLTKGDLDEINDVVRNATQSIWNHIEDHYHQSLNKVHQGLRELQVQTWVIQASIGQASLKKVSGLALAEEITIDLHVV